MEVNNYKRLAAHILDRLNLAEELGVGLGADTKKLMWQLEAFDRALDVLPSYEADKAFEIFFGKGPEIEDYPWGVEYNVVDTGQDYLIGDEIVDGVGIKAIVTNVSENYINYVRSGGIATSYYRNNTVWHRTGRNFPVVEQLLSFIKEDKEC